MITESDLYFVIDPLWRIGILDGYNAVIKCKLVDYIKQNEIKSFMFETPVDKKEEFEILYSIADYRVGHSGASYGITMRIVERMIKLGFDEWKLKYIAENRPDMLQKINIINARVKQVFSNPSFNMCRNRLRYEFELLI